MTPGNSNHLVHGNARKRRLTPAYKSWQHMLRRCRESSNNRYGTYGARGIRVCERWLGKHGFANFLADMGPRPPGTSIDRINNNGNYEPGNCRWATRLQQGERRSNNRYLTVRGETLHVAGWSRKTGLTTHVILRRLGLGWSEEDAVSQPLRWSK